MLEVMCFCEVSGSSESEIARWTGFMTQVIILKENKHQLLHVIECTWQNKCTKGKMVSLVCKEFQPNLLHLELTN